MSNDAIANMIRENKAHQIATALQTGSRQGMQSMDMHLAALVREGMVSMEAAWGCCVDPATLTRLSGGRPS